ncbi:MAG TPA: methyltransferase domain-containing protein [Candidatus Methanomethylicus sp.]|nr:methyltransferase domain-containing protein [Candidatus Methanomethylicus sp.]
MSGTASRDAMDAYDCIAQDFKAARRRAWPSIKEVGNCAGMTVLDLGAGAGRNAVALAEADAALVVAADISIGMLEGMVSEGRHLDRIMPVLCDAMALPFREGAFDAAVCIAMIHHIAGW